MTTGPFTFDKLLIFFGLAGFVGCFLSIIIAFFFEENSSFRTELVSTFFLASSFSGLIIGRVLPNFILLNIFIALSCGGITTFLSSHFFYVTLKKTFDHEIEV